MSNRIETLYKNFGVLADAKGDISQHEKEYKEILEAVKGDLNEKRLAAQFITRFFHHFPNLSNEALDAQFDLCEDDDSIIRKKAIKDLALLCQGNKKVSLRVADALTQLLQAEDAHEVAVVQQALLSVFKCDGKGAILGIFNQVKNGEDGSREKGLKFIESNIETLDKVIISAGAEELLVSELKKAYQDASAEEIPVIINILTKTKIGRTPVGMKDILDFVVEQLEIESPFEITDEDLVERLTVSLKQASPLFSKNLNSNKYVKYMCEEIIPNIKQMQGFQEGSQNVVDLLKQFAECSTFYTSMQSYEKSLSCLYEALIELLPLPETTDGDLANEPKLQFSYVECLLFSFHHLCRHHPDFISDVNRLKTFRKRLQYFARALQGYIRTLHEALQGKEKSELTQQENRLKAIALRTTTNINVLIKDFFHSPPAFKSVVIPSWKMFRSSQEGGSSPVKRKQAEESSDSGHGHQKNLKIDKVRSLELYHPPNGKYSSLLSQQSAEHSRPRGGWMSRGFFRRGRRRNTFPY